MSHKGQSENQQDFKMVGQALGASTDISPQAGPVEVEDHMMSDINMRRAAQVIGHQLRQIGDELESRWRDKFRHPHLPNLQVYPNMLIWRVINRRFVGSLHWSKIIPVVRASQVVPHLHSQAWQATIKWISWVIPHFPDWSCRTKCVLASAVLLLAAAVVRAPWKTSDS